ncbi:aspartate aminotransferase [Tribonema minus]|uniref:aspartate transaminase n=1 Tax=Tribonema minus TaxID=303371 RepID=A0A835YT06_9STRA|nr:aspartate aminotransferase [Tribonema minus]
MASMVEGSDSGADGVFSAVKACPPDALLGLKVLYNNDPADFKVDLTLGAYRTETGAPWPLPSVLEAERRITSDPNYNHEYLPIDGSKEFQALTRELLFGADCAALKEGRIATAQALGGTGALRLGFELLRKRDTGTGRGIVVYYPEQTWPNHPNVAREGSGPERVDLRTYRYYDTEKRQLDFNGLMEDLKAAPRGAVVLLHMCAHNPTGLDPTLDQWGQIKEAIKAGGLLPFFDNAYQGFASGDLDADAAPLRLFMEGAGMEMLVAASFSKNMGLYNARCGALHVVTGSAATAENVQSALKGIARPMYSNPSAEGSAVATMLLKGGSTDGLGAQWRSELKEMPARIGAMRTALRKALEDNGAPGDWSHITTQRGMFSYTGLTKPQVLNLRSRHHVYMADSGRMSMSGVNSGNVEYIARAMADVVSNP